MNNFTKLFKKNAGLYFFYFLIFTSVAFSIWLIFFSGLLQNLVDWLQWFIQNKPQYIYITAFFVAIAEGTLVLSIIPGNLYIVTLGIFLGKGQIHAPKLFFVIIIGAMLGDLFGYALGRFISKKTTKYQDNKYYLLGQEFIKKHGGKSVFFARFTSGLKEIVPAVAGILKMDFKKFMFFNFLGAIGWSLTWVGIGFLAGNYIQKISNIIKIFGVVLLIFILTTIFIFFKKNKDRLIKEQEEQNDQE